MPEGKESAQVPLSQRAVTALVTLTEVQWELLLDLVDTAVVDAAMLATMWEGRSKAGRYRADTLEFKALWEAVSVQLAQSRLGQGPKECAHQHKSYTVGCVSCVLVFGGDQKP